MYTKVSHGHEAVRFAEVNDYDVIVLDLMLPGIDGFTVLQELWRRRNRAHVLILSAKDQTEDRIRGLDMGADDYLTKPFSFDELLSRIRALVRRHCEDRNPNIELGEVRLDTIKRRVWCNGRILKLTRSEFTLLEYLARRRGQVFSHAQLIEQLHDASTHVGRNAIEAHISTLRKKLRQAQAPALVRTRRGFGYVIE